jgi:chorismate synthase
MSNGQNIVCRLYHKPLSTLGRPLNTVDINTRQPAKAAVERSDVCAVPRAGVISEAMLALVLGEAMMEKFGGDHIKEIKANFQAYIKSQEKSS